MKKSVLLLLLILFSLCGCSSLRPAGLAEGTFISYATQSGQSSYDSPQKNSVFTSALLTYLSSDDDVQVMTRKVSQKVFTDTKGLQHPVSYSNLDGSLKLSQIRSAGMSAHALIIGNSAYLSSLTLMSSVSDAKSVSAALKGLGFKVTQVLNSKLSDSREAFNEFTKSAARADIVVVFYSGLGIQIQGEDFIVPVDVTLDGLTDKNFPIQTISWKNTIDSIPNKTKIIFIDADRTNPFTPQVKTR